jgi:hypothetical protein
LKPRPERHVVADHFPGDPPCKRSRLTERTLHQPDCARTGTMLAPDVFQLRSKDPGDCMNVRFMWLCRLRPLPDEVKRCGPAEQQVGRGVAHDALQGERYQHRRRRDQAR